MLHFTTNKIIGLALGLSLLTASTCASADVVVTGGSPVQQHALLDIYATWIPQAWHTHVSINVNILTDRDMNAYIHDGEPPGASNSEDDNSIDGIFEDHPARITLRGSADPNEFPMTFAHEYGHYVWQEEMSQQDHARYSEIYNRQREAHQLVTDYAATELDEGFAEAVSYYLLNRPVLEERDAASAHFLDDILNRENRSLRRQ
jgi:hypothetical protein